MKTDVAILGGGIVGCALADTLAQCGRRVVIVERGRVGAEASSAAAGILSAQMDLERPGPFFELCQASRVQYPGWVRQLERRSGVPVGYRRCGILYLATTRRQVARMASRARWQRRRGLPVEQWSPAEVRRREPRVDRPVRAGFVFPRDGQVDNVALMRALAIVCRRIGARIWEHTAVHRILQRRGMVRGVATSRGTLEAPIVVNCLGSWADLGGRFPVPLRVRPARGQMLAFDGKPGLFRRAVMSERAYVVQRPDGRLLVGSTVELAGFDKRLTLEGVQGMLAGLRRMTRAVDGCALVDRWAGFRPLAPDQRPVLGATRIPGLYVATGHFRHGILLAPITAELLTALILRGEGRDTLAPFAASRFARSSRR